MASGSSHSCELHRDGRVDCWGGNDSGQAQAPAGSFAAIAAGGVLTCGIRTDGALHCWGGQDRVEPPAGRFTAVALGGSGYEDDAACALDGAGSAHCWGDDAPASRPVDGEHRALRAISLGAHFACGIDAEQALACWGQYAHPALAAPEGAFQRVAAGFDYACGLRAEGTLTCWGRCADGVCAVPAGRFSEVAAASRFACALRADGRAQCWGDAPSPPRQPLSALSAGAEHMCAIDRGRSVCWSADRSGEALPPFGPVQALDTGNGFACAVLADGQLRCWGHGSQQRTSAPAGRFRSLALGNTHGCALRADGGVRCWGEPASAARTPRGRFIEIAATGDYNCGLRRDRTISCWGGMDFDMPEVGRDAPIRPPEGRFDGLAMGGVYLFATRVDGNIEVASITGALPGPSFYGTPTGIAGPVRAVCNGNFYVCVIDATGAASCSGDFLNPYGPVVAPAGELTDLSCDSETACALRADGTPLCWGRLRETPAVRLRAIAAANSFVCGIRADDDTVLCWGSQARGLTGMVLTPPS